MTHKILNISESTFTAAVTQETDKYVYFNNTTLNLTGFNGNNGYFYFDIKASNADDINYVRTYFYAPNSDFCYSDPFSLSSYSVNTGDWVTYRFPVTTGTLYGSPFDPSSSWRFQIGVFYASSESHYVSMRNMYIEYGTEVNSLMQFSIVASGAANAIGLQPEWDYASNLVKIEKEHRLENGDLYVYKTGDYTDITMSLKYVSLADASVINSLWLTNAVCNYFMANSYEALVSSVIIRNKKKPFQKFQQPYNTLMEGKIELEGID